MSKIHPTAIINKGAKISSGVEIGPYSVIGENVIIGENTVIKSHIVIEGNTEIGKNNIIFPYASIGLEPQDLKYSGEKTFVKIGDNNKIREHVTIHLGTKTGANITTIGSNCLIMVGTHIAHDCVISDNVILANNVTLAGHVEIGKHAFVGGMSAVHQFVRIGSGAMIGGMSGVESDVIPYGLVMGERAFLEGLNLVGLRRRNISRLEIHDLRHFFKELFFANDKNFIDRIDSLSKKFESNLVNEVVDFLKLESSRSFCHPKDFQTIKN